MKAWYSYSRSPYTGTTAYYNLRGTDWYDQLMARLPEIQSTVTSFLQRNNIDIREYFNPQMVDGNKWESLTFFFWGRRNEKVIEQGREVFDLFTFIPGFVSLSMSMLRPNTHIKPHHGDTDAIYRIHIPIYIPAGLPDCGLRVGGIDRSWNENEIIVFNDASLHEAWNNTDKVRVILIIDVMREDYRSYTDKICENVISSFKYQYFTLKFKFIKKWPGWLKDIFRNSMKLIRRDVFK